MKKRLLEILECPECGQDLKCVDETHESDEIKSGMLLCDNRHSYEIRNFVPHFSNQETYVRVFDSMHKNSVHRLPSHGNVSVAKMTETEFLSQTGFNPKDLEGKLVLDAGCGGGRFIAYLRQYGAEVVGVDLLSFALMRCAKRYPHDSTAHFIQASLYHLPFKESSFDYIYSLGVLHHTPDPKAAFINLTRYLRKDGKIAIWVYPKYPRTLISDFLRPLTTRMPLKLLFFTGVVATVWYGPLLKIPKIGGLLKKILYHMRLPWYDQFNWRIHSFMDWYGPPYQFKYINKEIKQWFEAAGLSDIQLFSYATSAQGTKKS